MKLLPFFCLLCIGTLPAAEPAPAPALKTDKFKLGDWEDGIGYCQAVRVGHTVYISGSVGSGPMPVALKQAYDTLAVTLKHYGLTFQHVVKENIYTTDLEALKANLAARKAYYGKEFPATTWVQVNRLYEADHLVEVELIAVIPE